MKLARMVLRMLPNNEPILPGSSWGPAMVLRVHVDASYRGAGKRNPTCPIYSTVPQECRSSSMRAGHHSCSHHAGHSTRRAHPYEAASGTADAIRTPDNGHI